MSDLYETSSESSLSEDENESQASFTVTHNNNGSFTESKVLSTQEVFEIMQKETRNVCDIADVS